MALGMKTGGRVAGTPNKTTATMKAAIESVYQALQEKSGKPHGHFLEWAEDNETEFYKLASKLIPLQLAGDDDGGPIQLIIKRFDAPDHPAS